MSLQGGLPPVGVRLCHPVKNFSTDALTVLQNRYDSSWFRTVEMISEVIKPVANAENQQYVENPR